MRWWAILTIAVVLAGCGTSVEKQTYIYLENELLAQEYSDRWPAFQPFLKEGVKKAKAVYQEARGLEDEAGIAKLKKANKAFGEVFHGLHRIERLERSIRSDLDRLDRTNDRSWSTGSERRELWRESDRIFEDVHTKLAEAKPENEGEALALLGRQVSRIQTLERRVERVLDRAKRNERRDRKRQKKASTS